MWLKTYTSAAGVVTQSGRLNFDLVAWFDSVAGPGGTVFGVNATVGVGSAATTKLVSYGFAYATAADAVAAIDDIILNGS